MSVLATCHFLYFLRSSRRPQQLVEPPKCANCVHNGGRVPLVKAKRHPIFPGPETYHIGGVVISIDRLYLVRYRRSRCRWFSRCRRRRGRRAVFKSKAEKVMKQIRVRDRPPSVHRQDLPSASRALSLATLHSRSFAHHDLTFYVVDLGKIYCGRNEWSDPSQNCTDLSIHREINQGHVHTLEKSNYILIRLTMSYRMVQHC